MMACLSDPARIGRIPQLKPTVDSVQQQGAAERFVVLEAVSAVRSDVAPDHRKQTSLNGPR